HPPDHKDDKSADHSADEPCPFAGPIPSDRLPEVGSNKGACDSEERRYNEPGGLIGARVQKLCDYSCQKAYDQRPKNTHHELHFYFCVKKIGSVSFRTTRC